MTVIDRTDSSPIHHLTRLAAAVVVLAAVAAPAAATDWPQFRGPQGDGISAETGLLEDWPESGPPELWRVPLGEGYSGLSVVDGRVYTLFADKSHELVVALDAASGKELWRHQLDRKYFDGQGNGPRSTPTVDDGMVYVLSALGRLAALDAETGKELWSQDLKESFGARPPRWGISTSPRVVGNLLLLDVGGRDGASLVALRKSTGVVAWTAGNDRAGYSVPLPITVDGRDLVVFFTGTQLVAVSPEDGEELWSLEWKTSYDVNAAAPVFVPPDRLYVSSGYDTGAALLELSAEGGEVSAREVWRSRRMKNQFSSSIYLDGHIYGFDNAILKCLDAATGEEAWKARGFGHGSLTYADGHLYVLSDRGRLALVEATPETYREVASFEPLDGKCWTVPTVAGGRLLLRNEEVLAAYAIAAPEESARAGR